MQYEIKGGAFPVVVCQLNDGEQMITEKGSMVWMSPNMEMKTSGGGVGKMFSKAFSGESMFQNIYTARGGNALIAFGSSFPGQILALEIGPGNEIILQKAAFLASEPGVQLSMHFNKKLGTILGFNKVVPEEVAHAVAMQATAMAPIAIAVADCPADVVAHERQIAIEAMKQVPKNAGKPEAILEKIAEGKMRKFFEENTLLAQPVVGEKESIADYIHKADKDATVVAYKRFALGE